MALEVVAGRCAELAGAVFAGVFFAAGLFFADAAEVAGFAVFFADGACGVVPAAAAVAGGSFATRLVPGHSR